MYTSLFFESLQLGFSYWVKRWREEETREKRCSERMGNNNNNKYVNVDGKINIEYCVIMNSSRGGVSVFCGKLRKFFTYTSARASVSAIPFFFLQSFLCDAYSLPCICYTQNVCIVLFSAHNSWFLFFGAVKLLHTIL